MEKQPLPSTGQYDAPPPYSNAQQPMYPQQQQPSYNVPPTAAAGGYIAPPAGFNAPPAGYNAPPAGYNAPPANYNAQHTVYYTQNQPHQMQQTSVIISHRNPNVMMLGENPVSLTCPHCSAPIVTRIDYQIGTMVWLVAGLMILFGLWLGCCLIPFCINALKDVAHFCPNCNRHLGTKQRLS